MVLYVCLKLKVNHLQWHSMCAICTSHNVLASVLLTKFLLIQSYGGKQLVFVAFLVMACYCLTFVSCESVEAIVSANYVAAAAVLLCLLECWLNV